MSLFPLRMDLARVPVLFHPISAALLLWSAGACTGTVDGPGGSSGDTEPNATAPPPSSVAPIEPDPGCEATPAGATAIARLTPLEYSHTVQDILGVGSNADSRLLSEPGPTGFDTDASAYTTSQLHAERFLEVAQAISSSVPLSTLVGSCDVATQEAACLDGLLENLGKRLIRRNLTDAELADYRAFHSNLDARFSGEEKMRLALQAMLMSPEFLYRPTFVDKTPEERAADWEVAAVLSYSLWASAPDEILLDRAEAGALRTPEAIAEQTARMLADPRAKRRVQDFFSQFLELDALAAMEKDDALAPDFAATRIDMQTEVERLVDHAVWSSTGTLAELLTADYSFVSRDLARATGMPVPNSDWERVDLGESGRAGLLTTAGFMALNAGTLRSSPVRRGQFVRELLLCQTIPPPPDDVDLTIPALDPSMTNREQFVELTKNESCANCHSFMNPIGFAFEHFDAAGAYRESQNGKPIDATGELTLTDVDGPFVDATDLVGQLSESSTLHDCFTQQWFRYLYQRVNGTGDACTMDHMQTRFFEGGGLLPNLMGQIASTRAYETALREEN